MIAARFLRQHNPRQTGFPRTMSLVIKAVARCAPVAVFSLLVGWGGLACSDDWPQWRGPHRDGQWRETGVIDEFSTDQLPKKWRVPIGPGYSGPTVAKGRVYVTDKLDEPKEVERVHCFDEQTGRPLWKRSFECQYGRIGYRAGPRASVTIHAGRAFSLGATGQLVCLDAATGEVHWSRDLEKDYRIQMPNWGIAAAPLCIDQLVIVQIGGRDGACVVALDMASGAERWHALDDRVSYSAPILIKQADQDVLVVWTADSLAGLDPSTGSVHWKEPFSVSRMPIGVATPVFENGLLFVSSFYDGALMMRYDQHALSAVKQWREVGRNERTTKALHCMISTPTLIDGYVYGVDSYGELRCLDGKTGKRIWEDQTATPRARWSNIHMVQKGDQTWMFNERGELVIGKLSPEGFRETSRALLIEPTTAQLKRGGKGVCWAHPAFANRHVFARSDTELVCVDLTK